MLGPRLRRSQAERGARLLAGARIGFGLAALAAPERMTRSWVGGAASDASPRIVLGRALAGRDVALGLGVLLAARRGSNVRGWVEAGGLADGGDLLATLSRFQELPRVGRVAVVAVTAGAVAAACLVAPALEPQP